MRIKFNDEEWILALRLALHTENKEEIREDIREIAKWLRKKLESAARYSVIGGLKYLRMRNTLFDRELEKEAELK